MIIVWPDSAAALKAARMSIRFAPLAADKPHLWPAYCDILRASLRALSVQRASDDMGMTELDLVATVVCTQASSDVVVSVMLTHHTHCQRFVLCNVDLRCVERGISHRVCTRQILGAARNLSLAT